MSDLIRKVAVVGLDVLVPGGRPAQPRGPRNVDAEVTEARELEARAVFRSQHDLEELGQLRRLAGKLADRPISGSRTRISGSVALMRSTRTASAIT